MMRYIKLDNEKGKMGVFPIAFFVSLVAIVFLSGYIIYIQRPSAIHNFDNPYPLVDPARSYIAQEHFFSTIEPLRKTLKEIVAKYESDGNRIGLYFEYLNTGANVSINQGARFWPASLSKMPTVFAVMKKVEKGEWDLSNELVLFSEDQDERFGDLYKNSPGTRFTIEELVKQTLVQSDNTAHRILVRNLASEDYTDMFFALGIEELFDENYDITAKEYSRIFRSLYNASYLNRVNSEKVLMWLTKTSFNNLLGIGVPEHVVFSHKIGEEHEEKIFLDSGIVYVPNRPYLITVMVEVNDWGGFDRASEIMGEIADEAYKYVADN